MPLSSDAISIQLCRATSKPQLEVVHRSLLLLDSDGLTELQSGWTDADDVPSLPFLTASNRISAPRSLLLSDTAFSKGKRENHKAEGKGKEGGRCLDSVALTTKSTLRRIRGRWTLFAWLLCSSRHCHERRRAPLDGKKAGGACQGAGGWRGGGKEMKGGR